MLNELKIGDQTIPEWTAEEDKKLFTLYKIKGSCWSSIVRDFPNRTESQIKNRFYSTLRRVATKKCREAKTIEEKNHVNQDILKYVDDALEYGHTCFTKRGRRKMTQLEKLQANPIKLHKIEPVQPHAFKASQMLYPTPTIFAPNFLNPGFQYNSLFNSVSGIPIIFSQVNPGYGLANTFWAEQLSKPTCIPNKFSHDLTNIMNQYNCWGQQMDPSTMSPSEMRFSK